MGAVVGGIDDNRIVRDTQVIQFIEQNADVTIVLEHSIVVKPLPRGAQLFFFNVSVLMHAGGIKPDEERLTALVRLIDKL